MISTQVCNDDYGVEGSGVQSNLHAILNSYLGDYFKPQEDVYNIGVGPGGYICMLAVCLCASGYTYAGQFFIPDFGSMCGDLFCGNTCCVPTDEWDGTYDKMKKWANEGRIPQWVLDKAAAAAGD